jgi:predicted enzyme related to lactoylglutathione lyase
MKWVTGIGGIFLITSDSRLAKAERSCTASFMNEGVAVDPRVEESEYGWFGWVMDPEGNRIELWEPPTVGI